MTSSRFVAVIHPRMLADEGVREALGIPKWQWDRMRVEVLGPMSAEALVAVGVDEWQRPAPPTLEDLQHKAEREGPLLLKAGVDPRSRNGRRRR